MRRRRGFPLALLIGFCCHQGLAAAPPATSDKSRTVAQKVYSQGVDHYKAGRMVEALAAFRASYDMVPSPNSHLMIARTLRDRGDLVEAYAEYGKVVTEAEEAAQREARYRSAAEASRAERAKLRARLTSSGASRCRSPRERWSRWRLPPAGPSNGRNSRPFRGVSSR